MSTTTQKRPPLRLRLPSIDDLRAARARAEAERVQLVSLHEVERRGTALAYVNGAHVEPSDTAAKLAEIDAIMTAFAELEMAATYRELMTQRLEAKAIAERPDAGSRPGEPRTAATEKNAAYARIELLDKRLNGLPDRAKAERIVAELGEAEY